MFISIIHPLHTHAGTCPPALISAATITLLVLAHIIILIIILNRIRGYPRGRAGTDQATPVDALGGEHRHRHTHTQTKTQTQTQTQTQVNPRGGNGQEGGGEGLDEPLLSESEDCGMCVVCQDGSASHAFVPCGHQCVCRTCLLFWLGGQGGVEGEGGGGVTGGCSTCPMCRRPFDRVIEIFPC